MSTFCLKLCFTELNLQVVDPPKVRLTGNHISCEGGYGITVGRKRASRFTYLDNLTGKTLNVEQSNIGDAPLMRSLNEKG